MKNNFFLFLLLFICAQAHAQVGIGTATPNNSAQLEVVSATKGFLMPRMTEAQRNAIPSPATGLMIYQTDNTPGIYCFNGTAWQQVGASMGWALSGNAGITAANFIGTLEDQPLNFRINNQSAGYLSTLANNTAFGYQTLLSATGGNNTAVGSLALRSNSTGNSNTAVGVATLTSNTLGSNNLAMGFNALFNNTSGATNVALGNSALINNNTGSQNVAVGYQAGPQSGFPNLTNTIAIGTNARVTQSNAMILGGTGANAVQVGIGNTAPHASALVEMTSANRGLLIPRINQASRPLTPATGLLIYQTDGTPGFYYYDGTAWQRFSDNSWNLTGNAGTTNLNYIGTSDNRPLLFKVNGQHAGLIQTGNLGGSVSLGFGALQNVTTGQYNVSFGFRPLFSNTDGSNNIGFGFDALYNNVTGSSNTAIGRGALDQNITGNNNIAIGALAASRNVSGNHNIAIGYNSGPDLFTDLTNSIAIGYNAKVNQSNTMILGGTDINAVQVGIGNTGPHASAQMEITSTDKGLLIPRIPMGNRPASPATGLLIYQTDNIPGFYYYDGVAWKQLSASGFNDAAQKTQQAQIDNLERENSRLQDQIDLLKKTANEMEARILRLEAMLKGK